MHPPEHLQSFFINFGFEELNYNNLKEKISKLKDKTFEKICAMKNKHKEMLNLSSHPLLQGADVRKALLAEIKALEISISKAEMEYSNLIQTSNLL